ncbi:MAG: hypothetical protein IT282_07125, partial [Bacteroidetes bacterium]|nr:hypothetical protein [Bacteroidota bacterium]
PIQGTDGFNWGSAYGLSVDGRERVRQRDPEGALVSYRAALEVDSTFLPALAGAAELHIRKVEYDSALIYAKRGLAIDAYDPETNYVYGLVQRHRGKRFDAMDGFGIASRSVTYRTAALVQLAEMAIVDNQWANAAEYALRASQTDAANIPSLQLLSILARRAGDTASAVEHLRRIDVLDPLSHFARFERYRLSPTEQNRNAFTSFVRNELPHESYLELASLYVRLNLLGDGREVLLLAPKQPMVDLWLGYIADRMGRPEESKQYVERAVAASPAFAFPHRWEDLEVLRWARGRVQHWKISYYLALLSWSLGRSRDAEVYFAECGESPDFAPFYLTRAGFRADRPELALADYRRARAVGPDEWRTYNALATFCIDRGEHREALKVCVEAVERFPQSYVLTFLLARALLMNGQHRQSLAILDTLSILPFEGARFGRDAYRQACLIGALDTLRGRHMDAALALIARARLWPERLGAGRPYDVDERFEDFLEYRIFRAKGDEQRARRSLERVAEYSRIHADANSPSNLIGALALRDAGRFAEGRDLLVRWAEREPADDFVRWAREVFEGRGAQAVGLLRNMRARFWHGTARDKEAGLVATLVVEMR